MKEFSVEPSTLRRACNRLGIEYRSHQLTAEEFAALSGGKSKDRVMSRLIPDLTRQARTTSDATA